MVNIFKEYEKNAIEGKQENVKQLLNRMSREPFVIEAEALIEYLKENNLIKANTTP